MRHDWVVLFLRTSAGCQTEMGTYVKTKPPTTDSCTFYKQEKCIPHLVLIFQFMFCDDWLSFPLHSPHKVTLTLLLSWHKLGCWPERSWYPPLNAWHLYPSLICISCQVKDIKLYNIHCTADSIFLFRCCESGTPNMNHIFHKYQYTTHSLLSFCVSFVSQAQLPCLS